jgi:transcription elongation factor GreA-like protein
LQVEKDEDAKEEIINNLREGFKEMKRFKEGEIKGATLHDFLDEL